MDKSGDSKRKRKKPKVHETDPSASGTDSVVRGRDPTTGQWTIEKPSTPFTYRDVLKPQGNRLRTEVDPNIPTSLTPKGYNQMQLQSCPLGSEYKRIRKLLLNTPGTYWCDPDFPATEQSLGQLPLKMNKIEWKRIKDIHPEARFFTNDLSRGDIEQGALGDCWFLGALSAVACHPSLLDHVVPKNQEVTNEDYVGIFRARFWCFGQWTEILVDDRLPVWRNTNRLVFMHSSTPNEFWSALLEKAYAKLNGTYSNLDGGYEVEAMENLTGGIGESIDLSESKRPKDIKKIIQIYSKRSVLMGCSIQSLDVDPLRTNGLVPLHAYAVTGIASVNVDAKLQYLVRCRNPAGTEGSEWNGAWSDGSPDWEKVSEYEKAELNVEFKKDGEFWIPYESFVECFTSLECCHLGCASLDQESTVDGKYRLEEKMHTGSWRRLISAGGCLNNKDTFHLNPQFVIDVTDPDPNDNESMCNVIIELIQNYTKKKVGDDLLTIGFVVYSVPKEHSGLLSPTFLRAVKPSVISEFADKREVARRLKLVPGKYVVIPSTFLSNKEGEFLLRIVSETKIKTDVLDLKNKKKKPFEEVANTADLVDTLAEEDAVVEKRFEELCDPTKKTINAVQLKKILDGSPLKDDLAFFDGFSLDVCRGMVAAMDANQTGLMENEEFRNLWNGCKVWKQIFLQVDIDESGNLSGRELREALSLAGYQVSNLVFASVKYRYSNPETDAVSFADFVHCLVRLKNAFDTFQAHPKNFSREATFTQEDYLRLAVYQ